MPPTFLLTHHLRREGVTLRGARPPALSPVVSLLLLVENEREVMRLTAEVVAPADHPPDYLNLRFIDLDAQQQTLIDDLVDELDGEATVQRFPTGV